MERCRAAILPWKGRLFSLSLVFPQLINLCFFYFGLAFEENAVRRYGFIAANVLFAVVCGVLFLCLAAQKKFSRRTWLLWIAVAVYFLAAVVCGTVKGTGIVSEVPMMAVFCVPAFLCGIFGADDEPGNRFFADLERLGILALPMAVIYLTAAVSGGFPWGNSTVMGIFNYMTLAYTFMPFVLAGMVRLAEDGPATVRGRSVKCLWVLRVVYVAVFFLAILASGTRGTMVCVFGFGLIWIVVRACYHQPLGKAVCLVAGMVVLFVLLSLIALPGFERMNRMDVLWDGLKTGELVTSGGEDPLIRLNLQEWISAETFPEDLVLEERGTLYLLALGEFLKRPLFGMGAGGFQGKYHIYPHNAVLEALCETGIVGTVVLAAIVIFAIVRLLQAARTNMTARGLIPFFAAFALRACISGSLWECSALFLALGYCLSLRKAGPRKGETGAEPNARLQ